MPNSEGLVVVADGVTVAPGVAKAKKESRGKEAKVRNVDGDK